MLKVNVATKIGLLRSRLKKLALRTSLGTSAVYKARILREKMALARYSDLEYITTTYKKHFGREINLKDPSAYTEKLQWLKLFYRDTAMPVCADKYEVRGYLESKGLGYLLNDLIGVYEDADNIEFSALPQRFVAKATHGSSWNLICRDKSTVSWRRWKKTMNSWLKLNLYVFGREWNYKDMRPRIVVEQFLEQDPLVDYKFLCFNGEPRYVQTNFDKDGIHYIDFYDLDWRRLNLSYQNYQSSSNVAERPSTLSEMIRLAKELSGPFPFARIDFYDLDSRIVFGEITFFPNSGLWALLPIEEDHDATWGAQLVLPEPNHNIDLYRKIQAGQKSQLVDPSSNSVGKSGCH